MHQQPQSGSVKSRSILLAVLFLVPWSFGTAAALQTGDLLVVSDLGYFPTVDSRIDLVNPLTGRATTLATLNNWEAPVLPDLGRLGIFESNPKVAAMAVDRTGGIVVLASVYIGYYDTRDNRREVASACLVKLDPITGTIRTITRDDLLQSDGERFGDVWPSDFDFDSRGNVIVAQRGELIYVDAVSGTQTSFSRFGRLDKPIAVAVAQDNGDVFVQEQSGNIIKIDGASRAQTVFFDMGAYFQRPADEILDFGLYLLHDILVDGDDLIAYGVGCVVRFSRSGSDPTLIKSDNSLFDLAFRNTGGTMAQSPSRDLIIAGLNIEPPNSLYRVPINGGPPEVFALLRDYTIAGVAVVGEITPPVPELPALAARMESGTLQLRWPLADGIRIEESEDLEIWGPASGTVVIQGTSGELHRATSDPGRYFRLVRGTGVAP